MGSEPRGVALNNPGNIRISSAPWLGKVNPSSDPDFEQFTDAKYGIRAMAVIINNYYSRDGIVNLRGIISRWSPPSENDTNSYLSNVCAALGCKPDDPFDISDPANLADLLMAIIHQEQGSNPYDFDIIDQAIQMSGTTSKSTS